MNHKGDIRIAPSTQGLLISYKKIKYPMQAGLFFKQRCDDLGKNGPDFP